MNNEVDLIQERWNEIPVIARGDMSLDMLDGDPQIQCPIIAKRALIAAYGDHHNEDPETIISDLLADLMHLCDKLNLDFDQVEDHAFRVLLGRSRRL